MSKKLDTSKKFIVEKICCYVYVVDNLKTNLFIELDILDLKQITINYKREILYIDSCRDIQVSIKITLIKNKIKKIVKTFDKTIILAYSSTIISVRLRNRKLLKNCNLMFISTKDSNRFESNNKVLLYIIDINLYIVQVNNILSQAIIVSKNSCLDIVYKYKKKDCYAILSKYSYFVVDSFFLRFDF